MTIWGLLAACRRKWPLLLVGFMLTAGTFLLVDREPGVYWAQTDLVFLAPTSSRFPNSLNTSSESLINTASVIARQVDVGDDLQATSSSNVTLVDDGVRDGVLVRLPNLGGQWASNYAKSVLDVQAVAGTPQIVAQRMAAIEAKIRDALAQAQNNAGVDAVNRISIQASPETVDVKYVHGNRTRARGLTLVLGVGLTLAAVVVADRRKLQLRGWYANVGRHSSAIDEDSVRTSPEPTPSARVMTMRRPPTRHQEDSRKRNL